MCVHGEPTAIDAQFNINLFKRSPKEKTDFKFSLIIRNVIVEYTNDLVKNLAKAVLAFRLQNIHNRSIDIVIRTNAKEFQQKLEFHTMIMYLTKTNVGKNLKNMSKSHYNKSRIDDDTTTDMDDDWHKRREK